MFTCIPFVRYPKGYPSNTFTRNFFTSYLTPKTIGGVSLLGLGG